MTELDGLDRKLTRRAALAAAFGMAAGGVTLGLLARIPRTASAAVPVAEAAPKAPPPLKDWPTLDAIASDMVEARMVPGVSLSVMRGGVMLYSKGFGLADVESQTAVAPDTSFRIASITKQFTAAAVLKLAEEGKLTLDDPLAAHLPDFPRAGDITLRQLLSHTAGLGDYINGQDSAILNAARERDYSTDDMLALIRARQPLYRAEPGARFMYSNSGYTLLSTVVEKCSGKDFATYCEEALFTPAAMSDTAIDPSCDESGSCHGYVPRKGGFETVRPLSPTFLRGAGAMRSTSADLVRWHAALLDGKVLKPQSVEAMLTPAHLNSGAFAGRLRPNEPMTYGLGQNLGELKLGEQNALHVFAHSGGIRGFTGHLRGVREPKVSIAVLYNSDGGGARRFHVAQRALRTEAIRLGLLDGGIVVPDATETQEA